ncbi:MAG: hypothetical protein PF482_00335 [Desulfobacteraceae bacterium]|jgi:hypothetical protein|nr:hypothetical protein [Desulfobacteraceae bacterium]
MHHKDFEVRVMKYFTENINLPEFWKIAKECSREFCYLSFEDIISGDIELPSIEEIKEKIADKIPYEFEKSGFVDSGPIDLSGIEEAVLGNTLVRIESMYEKFHDALTLGVAKAVKNEMVVLQQQLHEEIDIIKKKYLS